MAREKTYYHIDQDHYMRSTTPNKSILSLPTKKSYVNIDRFYSHNIAKNKSYLDNQYLKNISLRKETLITGTLNLINYIITQHKNGTPLDTVVFLDKSARLGAYFFRKMWRVLKKQLPDGIKMPKNKFINIGQYEDDKYSSNQAKDLATKIFSKQELGNNVLVVDEHIVSGDSAKEAISFLKENYQINAQALELYYQDPSWSHTDSAKGIKDVELDYSFYGLRGISKENFNTINSFITSFKDNPKILESIIEKMRETPATEDTHPQLEELLNQRNIFTSKEQLDQIINAIQEIERTTDTDEVIRFFKSSGGYLGLRETNKDNIQHNALYRTALSSLAKAYGEQLEAIPAS